MKGIKIKNERKKKEKENNFKKWEPPLTGDERLWWCFDFFALMPIMSIDKSKLSQTAQPL